MLEMLEMLQARHDHWITAQGKDERGMQWKSQNRRTLEAAERGMLYSGRCLRLGGGSAFAIEAVRAYKTRSGQVRFRCAAVRVEPGRLETVSGQSHRD